MFERILITAGRARSRCTAVHPAALFAGKNGDLQGLPERDFAQQRRLSSVGPPASNSLTKMAVARACACANASNSESPNSRRGLPGRQNCAKSPRSQAHSNFSTVKPQARAFVVILQNEANFTSPRLRRLAQLGYKVDNANYGHFFPAHGDSSVRSSRDAMCKL